jgi:hypothetical protein
MHITPLLQPKDLRLAYAIINVEAHVTTWVVFKNKVD